MKELKNVKALIIDSLYAYKPVKTPSESVARELLREVMISTNSDGKADNSLDILKPSCKDKINSRIFQATQKKSSISWKKPGKIRNGRRANWCRRIFETRKDNKNIDVKFRNF